MSRIPNRLASLMLALLMSVMLVLAPAASLAAKQEEQSPLELLAAELIAAQTEFDLALADHTEWLDELDKLEAQYERNDSDLSVQDALINAMVEEEEAAVRIEVAQAELVPLLTELQQMQLDAECETLTAEHDGKFADLLAEVLVDENMVIYGLTVTVTGGDERDQLVSGNGYLFQFLGKTIPVSVGNSKDDDVKPLANAQQTSKDLAEALNSLVYVDDEPTGPIIEPQAIADYIFKHGKLPDNFITKKEAQKLGWDSSYNYVSDVAPGKSIGGDRFGNYEGLLPSKKGRQWYEADCYYTKGKRNAHRILYSSDGLVYYTADHYESFTEVKPSK